MDQTGSDRLKDFMIQLLQVTNTLVVTKVEEVNGVKLFTLATPDGRSFNQEIKNSLLGIKPAAAASPQNLKGWIFVQIVFFTFGPPKESPFWTTFYSVIDLAKIWTRDLPGTLADMLPTELSWLGFVQIVRFTNMMNSFVGIQLLKLSTKYKKYSGDPKIGHSNPRNI